MANNLHTIVTIFGGSGFIGSALVKELIKQDYIVKIITRDVEKVKKLKIYSVPGRINIVKSDIYNQKDIEDVIIGSDIVINLIATFDNKDIDKFQYLHAQLPEKIAKFCTKHNVKKLIHMSNLGIENGATLFAKTRILGENAIFASFPSASILRSSLIIGENDSFLRVILILAKKFSIIPLITNGKEKILLQPIYVENIAQAIAQLIKINNNTLEKNNQSIYKIAGAEIFTLKEIYGEIQNIIEKKIYQIPINIEILKLMSKIISLKIFNPINGLLFGSYQSPLSSEKLNAIKFNSRIEKNDVNFLCKLENPPILFADALRKIYKSLF